MGYHTAKISLVSPKRQAEIKYVLDAYKEFVNHFKNNPNMSYPQGSALGVIKSYYDNITHGQTHTNR